MNDSFYCKTNKQLLRKFSPNPQNTSFLGIIIPKKGLFWGLGK